MLRRLIYTLSAGAVALGIAVGGGYSAIAGQLPDVASPPALADRPQESISLN
jgi:hypothetical protein